MKKNIEIPSLEIASYDYELPLSRIAEKPLPERDQSKLLIWKNGEVQHDQYFNLAAHLPTNAHLVFNDTKVIAARLIFKKSSGGEIEIFLLEPGDGQYAALHDREQSTWKCLVGGLKKWKEGEVITLSFQDGETSGTIDACIMSRGQDHCMIRFNWQSPLPFHALLTIAGKIPLPPYIKRMADENDANRYQTVYADKDGSVAAPTAGLHFTERIFKTLNEKGIGHSFVTLHVGAGTFKPVTASKIADHAMHEEFFDVSINMIKTLCETDLMIFAVGTTSLRTLESLYWIGCRLMRNETSDVSFPIRLEQWEHFAMMETDLPDRVTVFRFLSAFMEKRKMERITGHTGICITPGYPFKVIRGLITNFHQPQSTLLLLIAAIMGDDWKRTYEVALREDYRFLSYGDGSLLYCP